MFVAGLKSEACGKVMASGAVQFIGLGQPSILGSEVEGFRLNYPFVSPYVIPVNIYSTQDQEQPGEPQHPVASLSVRSMLRFSGWIWPSSKTTRTATHPFEPSPHCIVKCFTSWRAVTAESANSVTFTAVGSPSGPKKAAPNGSFNICWRTTD